MTLTVTAARSFVSDTPQLLLKVTGTATAPAVDLNAYITSITRIHADGSRWAVLTSADAPRLSAGIWTWLDYMAPYNSLVKYEVKVSGVTATSTATTLTSTKAWLLSPMVASQAFQIDGIKEIAERNTASRAERFQPIGGEAIFVTDGRRDGIAGSITLRVPVANEVALKALLWADTMVLINTPGTTGWDLSWLWVQPQNVSYGNPSNLVSHPYRTVQISFQQGAQPYAEVIPVWTSGTAATYFAAQAILSSAVPALYADSNALVTNTRL